MSLGECCVKAVFPHKGTAECFAQSEGHLYRDREGMICAQPKGWRRQVQGGKGRKGRGHGWKG